jgi:hypothetical protein
MKNRLLTPELLEALKPFPLYSQEETRIHEQKALAAFAIGPIRWYITEGSPEGDTFTFFGLVCGMSDTPELGYINADELAAVRTSAYPYGFPKGIELCVAPVQDFKPRKLKEIEDPRVKHYCDRMEAFYRRIE